MKTKQTKWMMLLAIMLTAITFTACGSDDDSESGGNGSGVNGYYISGNLYTNADFRNDVVWEYMRISQDAAALFGNPVPTWTLFDSNGLFFPKSSDGEWEYLRNNIEVIRVDDNARMRVVNLDDVLCRECGDGKRSSAQKTLDAGFHFHSGLFSKG